MTGRVAGLNLTYQLLFGFPGDPPSATFSGTCVVGCDSTLPGLSIGNASAKDGKPVVFPVSLSAPATQTVTVSYATTDGTAHAGTDYVAASGSLSFSPGETSKQISVQTIPNAVTGQSKTFTVALSNPVNATISSGIGVGTILPGPAVAFDWTVPDRFGFDKNGDGKIDYYPPDGTLDANPARWRVDFTYTVDKACPAGLTPTWKANGTTIAASDPAILLNDPSTCKFSYGFTAEGKYSVELDVKLADASSGQKTQDVIVQDWLIVSIGDSVASGEGNPDIPGGSAAVWENTPCHRSFSAGPAQAALALEQADKRTSVTFIHLACSGAAILDGLLGPYTGVTNVQIAAQIPEIRQIVGNREIDALLVSIGANDVHFSDVVQSCLMHTDCNLLTPGSAATQFERDLKNLPGRYDQLGAALQGVGVAPGRVYLTQYFDPTHNDAGQICADSILADVPQVVNAAAKAGFSITGPEATWAATTMLPELNNAGAQAATPGRDGWHYVGGIFSQFLDHGYCAANHWVVHFLESEADQGDKFGSLHPNELGHGVYGKSLAAALTADFYTDGDLTKPRLPAAP